MKILIATGIYPPKTSGPAQYAYNMRQEWTKMGHSVDVKTYDIENSLPTGIRHIYYFFKILPSLISSDTVFALDTYSVGFPAVFASKLFGKQCVIRTGGDFLWEGYVERTGDMVLLREFYTQSLNKFSLKEKVIFYITRWTLRNTGLLVFSTEWQRDIFLKPYGLDKSKTMIIENHYEKVTLTNGPKEIGEIKKFVASTRALQWKNIELLKRVFENKDILLHGASLDLSSAPHEEFLQNIYDSYAVILVSLGDISPHMILDAISLNKPFILTEENGLMNRIQEIAIIVIPKNENDIKEKILWLLDPDNYKNQVEKIKNFSFVRTWQDLATEYITIFEK